MPVAGSDLEAQALVETARPVEIADGENEVVKAAGHGDSGRGAPVLEIEGRCLPE